MRSSYQDFVKNFDERALATGWAKPTGGLNVTKLLEPLDATFARDVLLEMASERIGQSWATGFPGDVLPEVMGITASELAGVALPPLLSGADWLAGKAVEKAVVYYIMSHPTWRDAWAPYWNHNEQN